MTLSRTILLVALLLIAGCTDEAEPRDTTRQEEVAERGARVMPFDLDRTMHVFETTDDGGVQKVVVRDTTAREQITLIRNHLREEAKRFQRGDFSDPARIHGHDMPGLQTLMRNAERIDVEYASLPDGARLTYLTEDPELVQALHDWFGAQRSDHGRHARGHGES